MEWVAAGVAFVFAMLANLFPAHTSAYFAGPLSPPSGEAHILFGGDLMFDRTVRTTVDEKGGDYVFSCIDSVLEYADLVVANLEGPITSSSSRSVGSAVASADNYVFTFPTSTAVLLAAHNVKLVTLGNNHIFNFGSWGVRQTTQWLDAAGVGYFGDPLTRNVAEKTVGGISFAFINYNQFLPGQAGTAASTTLAQIADAKAKGELPVVFSHWGDEYKPATDAEKTLAHEFVDAGAALVVGAHPHVVQEHERYKGVPVYYSLGNFIFDQYWNDAVDHGLLLRVTFDSGGVSDISEMPVELRHDRRTCLAP